MAEPFSELRSALVQRALSAANQSGLVGVCSMPNAPFTAPAKGSIYADFWYRLGESRKAELGGRAGFKLTVGIYQFDIMVPEAKGDGPGIAIGDRLVPFFDQREMVVGENGYLKLLTANLKTPFNKPANGYWQVIVDGTLHYYYRDPAAKNDKLFG